MIDRELEDEFDNLLDELYPEVQIGALRFLSSKIVKLCDEVAYDIWYWDWRDQEGEAEEG